MDESLPTPGSQWGQRVKRTLIKGTILTVLAGIAGVALWIWISLTYVYSSGERAGYVQKFSKRGWVIKTWEGELAMVNLPGAMTEKFTFTVRDDAVAKRIETSMGQRVRLSYEQHRALPGQLFGDTEYFVVNVQPVAETQ